MAYTLATLKEFMQDEARQHTAIPADIYTILYALASASKKLLLSLQSSAVKKNTHDHLVVNLSGDLQHELDRKAHEVFIDALANIGVVGGVISEEAVGIINIADGKSPYIVAIDPLDGSANVAVNAASGTIFSIYRRLSLPNKPIQTADILQPGIRQIAAGYILYGTYTVFVYGTVYGVHGFVYDPTLDAFLLTYQAMKFPQKPQSYAINDGHAKNFPETIQHYLKQCRQQGLGSRYSGALVADFHRHLLQGGIYLYPSTEKKPNGKLRLMFECNPLAFLAVQAGGWASDGNQDVLSLEPHAIHQCIPFYVGSESLVKTLLDCIKKT
jgi:fructose-1,6-bisphosphatase I